MGGFVVGVVFSEMVLEDLLIVGLGEGMGFLLFEYLFIVDKFCGWL